MTSEERCNLVLAFARVLYVNGQATDQTAAAAERIGQISGLRVKITPRWGALQLESDDGGAGLIRQVAADPTGVHMGRVASAMQAIADAEAGRLTLNAASTAIDAISRAPPAPTWLFALAAGAGAVALAVIFGVEHLAAAILIFVCAAAGAILRRGLARLSGERLCPAGLRGDSRRRHRRRRVSLSVELFTAPCCDLPMHGLGPGATRTQRRDGPHPRRHPFGRRASDLCNVGHRGDLDGTAVRTGPSRKSRFRSTNSAGPFRYGRT